MNKKELNYLNEYFLKEEGTISHDEYIYDKEDQKTFEAIMYGALKLYRSGKANKDKVNKAYEEFSKEPTTLEKQGVSMYTINYMYREHKLTKYLKTLDDQELELAFSAVKKVADEEAKDILESINMEKAYRHYSKILEALKEGKTK